MPTYDDHVWPRLEQSGSRSDTRSRGPFDGRAPTSCGFATRVVPTRATRERVSSSRMNSLLSVDPNAYLRETGHATTPGGGAMLGRGRGGRGGGVGGGCRGARRRGRARRHRRPFGVAVEQGGSKGAEAVGRTGGEG